MRSDNGTPRQTPFVLVSKTIHISSSNRVKNRYWANLFLFRLPAWWLDAQRLTPGCFQGRAPKANRQRHFFLHLLSVHAILPSVRRNRDSWIEIRGLGAKGYPSSLSRCFIFLSFITGALVLPCLSCISNSNQGPKESYYKSSCPHGINRIQHLINIIYPQIIYSISSKGWKEIL